MPNTTPASIGADAALARLVAAVEAETDPDWDCNSYHPSLWSALDVARAALASAAQPAPDAHVAAWMTPEGDRVVTEVTMAGARKDGGATLSSLRPYSIPLVRASAAPLLSFAPHFPDCDTPEPSLAALIYRYYRAHFEDRAQADAFARSYIRALASAAQPEREPHLPHRDCGCADCAPSFEPDAADPRVAPAPAAVAVPVPVKWWNGCDKTVPAALRYLANNKRPNGGEERFNCTHLYQLADEIERMARLPLYTAPVPAAQGDALDAQRYRELRRGQRWSVVDGIGDTLRGDALDAAIDAARAAKEGA